MNIAQAVAVLGYEETESQHLCVARFPNGKYLHKTLAECGHLDMAGRGDIYLAAGAFRAGSLAGNEGRTQENCVRVYDLAFDCDLSDYLGAPKQHIWAYDDATLDREL